MNGLVLLFAIAMIFLCMLVFWTYLNTVYGSSAEIITPYNTGNNISGYVHFIKEIIQIG